MSKENLFIPMHNYLTGFASPDLFIFIVASLQRGGKFGAPPSNKRAKSLKINRVGDQVPIPPSPQDQ